MAPSLIFLARDSTLSPSDVGLEATILRSFTNVNDICALYHANVRNNRLGSAPSAVAGSRRATAEMRLKKPKLCHQRPPGRPWSQDGLQTVWQRLKRDLEEQGKVEPALTLYGLRHTVAVILREAGHDERAIADALGQKTIEMARHYAKGADLGPKMTKVSDSFDAELNKRRTNSVKPSQEIVKPDLSGTKGAQK